MSDDFTKSVITEEERKRLISEISKIKEVLDSFKYGLNFEEFADELFKTVNRQTLSIKALDEKMSEIVEKMDQLEKRFKKGIKATISGAFDAGTEVREVIVEDPSAKKDVPSEEPKNDESLEKLKKEIQDIKTKIARLFEKENELEEMVMNDPAGADEYEEKAKVAREMRTGLEVQLKEMEERLN